MHRSLYWLLVVLVLYPARLDAAELTLVFEFAGPSESSALGVSAEILLRKLDRDQQATEDTEALRHAARLDPLAPLTLELEPALWQVEARAPGYWSQPLQVELGPSSGQGTVVLWPTGFVRAAPVFLEAAAQPEPETVSLAFRPSPGKLSDGGPEGIVSCAIEPRAPFKCAVPAGELDLQFSAPGFSRAFFWNVAIERDRVTDAGPAEFGPAAGILGWVEFDAGRESLTGVAIKVEPRGSRRPRTDTESQRAAAQIRRTTTNPRGFFQLQGLAPGAYVIAAHKEPYAPATASVRVRPNRVTEVADPPLVLRKPRSLEIYIHPPLPPETIGGPWIARLTQVDKGNKALRRLESIDCSFAGSCRAEDLAPGKYKLRVEASEGKNWFTETLVVDESSASHFVEIPVTRVRGSLSLGDDPLAARIFFGTKGAGIELASNEEGLFEGFLPRPGDWRVEVRAKAPKLRRHFDQVEVEANPVTGYAEVELTLPSTFLEGVVVDEQNLPVAGAIVTVRGYDLLLDSFTQQGTDDSGRFEFSGLPPGKLVLRAAKIRQSKRLHSGKVVVHLEEELESESSRLVLRPEARLRGRVVAYGQGVGGASVKAHSTTAMDLSVSKKSTDADGYFEISVPPDSQEILLGIAAVGFGYKIARTRLTPERVVTFSLEQAAGTLVIERPEKAAETQESPILAILHDGSLEAADYLQRFWAPLNGVVQNAPDRYVLPWLEAGHYSVCATDPVLLDQLAASGLANENCSGGYLPAGGELVLVLPGS